MTVHSDRPIAVNYVAPNTKGLPKRFSIVAPNQDVNYLKRYLDLEEAKDLRDQLTQQIDRAEGRV